MFTQWFVNLLLSMISNLFSYYDNKMYGRLSKKKHTQKLLTNTTNSLSSDWIASPCGDAARVTTLTTQNACSHQLIGTEARSIHKTTQRIKRKPYKSQTIEIISNFFIDFANYKPNHSDTLWIASYILFYSILFIGEQFIQCTLISKRSTIDTNQVFSNASILIHGFLISNFITNEYHEESRMNERTEKI